MSLQLKRVFKDKRTLLLPALSVPMFAMADNDIASIGTAAATEIAKFAVMITAIGTAVLSVIVLIQGFKMAFGMTKTAR